MDQAENFRTWLELAKQFELPLWEDLPELDLYMDQIMIYFRTQFAYLNEEEIKRWMSPAMINNYVKKDLLTRPNNKKYNKEQLSGLMQIAALKTILSIEDIGHMFTAMASIAAPQSRHDDFAKTLAGSVQDEISSLQERLQGMDAAASLMLARQLALEAAIKKILSERLLLAFAVPPPMTKNSKKEK
jgi:hypothetical protein